MFGHALYAAHRAFQAVGQFFAYSGDDPIIQSIQSREAWAKWQRGVKQAIDAARHDHGRTREIRERQRRTLHAALAANRNHGAPGHG